jgi:hypothetical protein
MSIIGLSKRVRFDLGVTSTKGGASGPWLWNLPTIRSKPN